MVTTHLPGEMIHQVVNNTPITAETLASACLLRCCAEASFSPDISWGIAMGPHPTELVIPSVLISWYHPFSWRW